MAIVRPPRVMTLMPSPNIRNTMNAIRREKGMEMSVMAVVRTLAKKSVMTMATTMAESRSASSTLVNPPLMNHSCRKMSPESTTHFGRFGRSSASASSIALVSASVFASFCLMIRMMTPDFPSMLASPRLFGSGAKTTSAISESVTIRVFPPEALPFMPTGQEIGTEAMTVFLSSSTSVVRASMRIGDSRVHSIMNPPTRLSFAPFMAAVTSSMVIP